MKKKELRRVLRGVLNLLENDLHEIADSVVEIDHREADHWRKIAVSTLNTETAVGDLDRRLSSIEGEDAPYSLAAHGRALVRLTERISDLEAQLSDHVTTYAAHAHPLPSTTPHAHSRKA